MDFNFERKYGTWAFAHSILNVLGLVSAMLFGWDFGWFSLVAISFLILTAITWKAVDLPYGFGLANWITSFRLAGLMILALFPHGLSDLELFFALLLLISLDGLDGMVARRWSHQSRAGELLDMETDAFLVLLMAWWHFSSGKLGSWILIPGAFRYLYEILGRFMPAVESEYLTKKVRATIAVIFFISLLIPFVYSGDLTIAILAVSSLLILVSFAFSILYRLGLLKK